MKAYRNYCLLCTVEISPEKVFTDDIPPSPLSPHIHQPAKLPAWESTALFSIRTHQVSLNRWIKPNPSLVYYLFSARNWTLENALALIPMLETNVKEALFPCLISTQPPSKSGSCLGAITKKTTKAETPGAKCVLLVWICPGPMNPSWTSRCPSAELSVTFLWRGSPVWPEAWLCFSPAAGKKHTEAQRSTPEDWIKPSILVAPE